MNIVCDTLYGFTRYDRLSPACSGALAHNYLQQRQKDRTEMVYDAHCAPLTEGASTRNCIVVHVQLHCYTKAKCGCIHQLCTCLAHHSNTPSMQCISAESPLLQAHIKELCRAVLPLLLSLLCSALNKCASCNYAYRFSCWPHSAAACKSAFHVQHHSLCGITDSALDTCLRSSMQWD